MPRKSNTPESRRARLYASGPESTEDEPIRQRRQRRPRALAVLVLVVVAVVIVLVGVAARDSGLAGSQQTPSTFKLLPFTTTTS